jgi:FtsP/CotA-like multicopper oxidase with cupredoxin domain
VRPASVSISLKRLGKWGALSRWHSSNRGEKTTINSTMSLPAHSGNDAPWPGPTPGTSRRSRRQFLRSLAVGSLRALVPALGLNGLSKPTNQSPSAAGPRQEPDFRIEIGEVEWELSAKKRIRTAAYSGQIPGQLLRLTEGKPVTIDIQNNLSWPEIVHWHGQWIAPEVDGSMEEGTPMIAPGARTRVSFTPRPTGLHWYHTHTAARRDLKRALYSGQFGVLLVEPEQNPGDYDQEQFIVLHDWEPYFASSDDGSQMVNYVASSINGRLLGHDDPIRVSEHERVLFHILNASATEAHWIVLPGHRFEVIALDGRPVPNRVKVNLLRLGPAERISAMVEMTEPGMWILGEARASFRDAGMGRVIEYANAQGKPQASPQTNLVWDYMVFGDKVPSPRTPDITIPLRFTSRFRGHGALDRWMINGKSFPETGPFVVHRGLRHRLVFDNRSNDDHPVHLHRHAFELVALRGAASTGIFKDVVVVEAQTTVAVDLIADNPGSTLFHCHQQDHMDSGFMAIFGYA